MQGDADHPFKANAPDREMSDHVQQIFHLVTSGDIETLERLLDRGLPANLCNHEGGSLLRLASCHGHFGTSKLLLDHGADIEGAGDDGRTALMLAAMFNHTAVVNLLLRRGAKLTATDANGMTALDAARMMGAPDTIAQLEGLQG